MPLTIAKLAARTADTSFEYAGETVHLSFYPAKVTLLNEFEWAQLEKKATDAAVEAEGAGNDPVAAVQRTIAEFVCNVLADWDVLEAEDGPKVPVTVDRVAEFDPAFLGACLAAIREASGLGKPTATESPAA